MFALDILSRAFTGKSIELRRQYDLPCADVDIDALRQMAQEGLWS